MSLYSTKLDQLYRFIGGKIILSRNLCRFIKGIHKFGPILSLHRCRKILIGFSYRFIGDKNVGQQNCIALFDFFLKKLCICIALNDFGWRLWPAKVVGRDFATLAGDFGRGLWPATLASDFGRRLWLWTATLAGDFGQRRL